MQLHYEFAWVDNEGETHYFEAILEGSPSWTNDGIGSYEYWGQKCFDAGTSYATMENSDPVYWDRSKYNFFQNNVIESYLKDDAKAKAINERFCEVYEQEYEPDYPD